MKKGDKEIGIWGLIVILMVVGSVFSGAVTAEDVAEDLTESVADAEIQDIVNCTTTTESVGSTPLKFTVYATREGCVGGTTANGHVIVSHDHFVALPSTRVLCSNGGHEYEVKVTYNGKSVTAPVWDVGPWNTKDNYWDPPSQREMWKDLPQGMPEAQAARDKETYPPDGYNGGFDETNYLVKVSTGSDEFSVGDRVRPTINGLSVRSTAGGDKIGTVSTSDRGTVIDGPEKAILGLYYRWWKIEWDKGLCGWSAQKRYVLNPAGIDLADGTFWDDLGMTDNDWVTVEFLWSQPPAYPIPTISASEYETEINVGETDSVKFTVTNDGTEHTNEWGIQVRVGDGLELVQHSSYPWDQGNMCNGKAAEWYKFTRLDPGESDYIRVGIRGTSAGSSEVKYTAWMHDPDGQPKPIQYAHPYYGEACNREYAEYGVTVAQPDVTPPPPPVISSSTHPNENNWYDNNDPSFTWTTPSDMSGIAGYSYTIDLSSSTTPDTSVDTTGNSKSYSNKADGTWYFHVRAKDGAGNWGNADHYRVKIDTANPPTPTISSSTHPNENNWYANNDPSFTWTTPSDTSGIAGYSYTIDHSSSTTPDTSVDTTGNSKSYSNRADGTWYFHVRAKDNAGNWGSADHYRVKIDTANPLAPTISSSTHPNENSWYANNDPSFTWTTPSDTSGIAGYSYALDHSSSTTPDTSVDTTGNSKSYSNRADGTWYFHVRAKDNAGNWGSADNYRVKIDTANPSVTANSPDGGENWKVGSQHAITWTATDNVGVTSVDIKYSTNGGSTYPYTIATGEPNDGTYTWTIPDTPSTTCRVRVIAYDAAGNSGEDESNSNFIIFSNNPPNTPSTPSGPTTGEIGVSYSYSTATTDQDGDDIYYWFDWEDGTNSGWIGPYSSGTSGSASKAWSNPNIYDVKAQAKDVHGAESSPQWSDSLSVCINGSWEDYLGNPCKKRRMTCYGEYEYKNKPDGTACDDDQYCTVNDACTAGVCEGSPRDCSALDDQCNVGVCNEDTDSCVKEPKSDGTDCCSDGKCDGWYDTGETKWANTTEYECKYDQKEQKEQKYRDYYCSGGSCTHVVTETQWVDTGNTQTVNKPDGTVCGHGDWETNPANPCEERREILKCMSGTCNPSGEYEYQNKPDGTNCGYGDWETNPENPCKERREILKCVSGTCTPSGEYDYQDKPDGTNCGYGEWENDPANPCKERREILKCVSGTCSPSGEYDYQDKPDGTICGCTANNTLKRCYEGSCSDTGICNSTVCGADSSCDGKKPGESCGTDRKCDSTCNCVEIIIFDTGAPANPYPSISGMHNGTIKPNQTITVSKLYTYPCAGTGGHTEHVRIWNDTWIGKEANWKGYKDDWHNITFDEPFTLFAEKTYNYEIRTGSYPQIIHKPEHTTLDDSFINCTNFIDANGKEYTNWIPAIKLFL